MKVHQNVITIYSVYKFKLKEDMAYFLELELTDSSIDDLLK